MRINPRHFQPRAGHFVYEICKRRKRAFRVKEMHFDNDEAAVAWIIRNQFARRNLTAMQRAELALKLKDALAAEAKKRQVRKPKSVVQKSAPQTSGKTRDELAKMAGVSSNTIRRVEKIVAEAEPEVVEAARRGSMSINAAFRTVAPEPREAAPGPSEPEADIDVPEAEERAVEPPHALPAAPVAEPMRKHLHAPRHYKENPILGFAEIPLHGAGRVYFLRRGTRFQGTSRPRPA